MKRLAHCCIWVAFLVVFNNCNYFSCFNSNVAEVNWLFGAIYCSLHVFPVYLLCNIHARKSCKSLLSRFVIDNAHYVPEDFLSVLCFLVLDVILVGYSVLTQFHRNHGFL